MLRELRSLEPERSSDVRSDAARFPGGGKHVTDSIFMKEALIKVSECSMNIEGGQTLKCHKHFGAQ